VWGELGQPLLLDLAVFQGRVRNGFFVEAGGVDFEHGKTHQLQFEMLYRGCSYIPVLMISET
jgi:hypothetical protein